MIDGMVVREMNHRCNFDVNQVAMLRELCKVPFHSPITPTRKKDQELVRLLQLSDLSGGFFSARMLDYIDVKNIGLLSGVHMMKLDSLLKTLEKSFEVLSIHDCFGFHPNNGNYVRQHYINILAEIADADLLNFIASQLTGTVTRIQRKSIAHLIRQAEYPLS